MCLFLVPKHLDCHRKSSATFPRLEYPCVLMRLFARLIFPLRLESPFLKRSDNATEPEPHDLSTITVRMGKKTKEGELYLFSF